MAADDQVVVNIRTKGGRQTKTETDQVAASLIKLGTAGKAAGAGLRTVGRESTRSLSRGLGTVSRQAKYAGLGLIGLAGYTVKAGIGFNAAFQDAEASFATFLGSRPKAMAFIEDLRSINKDSPFRLTDLFGLSRTMLGFGSGPKQTLATIDAARKAVQASGGDENIFERVVLALGQIKAQGGASAQDLNQLAQAGVPVNKILQRELGLTGQQVANIGDQSISADRVITAVTTSWNRKFGKAAKNAAGNWSIQTMRMRKDFEQLDRVATEPIFAWLNKKVAPPAIKALEDEIDVFNRKDIDFAEKFKLGRGVLRKDLGPLSQEVRTAINDLRIGDRLEEGFEKAAPKVADAAVRGAWKGADAFVHAWLGAGSWTKLASGAWLAHKLGLGKGAAKALGTLLTGGNVGGGGLGKLAARGSTPANPLFVVDISGSGGKSWIKDTAKKGGILTALGAGAKKAAPKALRAARFGGPAAVAADALIFADSAGQPADEEARSLARARAGVRAQLGRENFGRAGGDPAGRFRGGRAAVPPTRRVVREQPIVLTVEGKTLAKVVHRYEDDEAARGRRRP